MVNYEVADNTSQKLRGSDHNSIGVDTQRVISDGDLRSNKLESSDVVQHQAHNGQCSQRVIPEQVKERYARMLFFLLILIELPFYVLQLRQRDIVLVFSVIMNRDLLQDSQRVLRRITDDQIIGSFLYIEDNEHKQDHKNGDENKNDNESIFEEVKDQAIQCDSKSMEDDGQNDMLSTYLLRNRLNDDALDDFEFYGAGCDIEKKSNRGEQYRISKQRYSKTNNVKRNCNNHDLSLGDDLVDKGTNQDSNDPAEVDEGLETIQLNIVITSVVPELCGQ